MRLTLAREVEYVPAWNNNRQDKQPIKVKLRLLSTTERMKAFTFAMQEGEADVEASNDKFMEAGVAEIRNLNVNNTPIEDAATLMATPGLYGLYSEILNELLEVNGAFPKNSS